MPKLTWIRSYLPWLVIPLIWVGMMTSYAVTLRSDSDGAGVSILAGDYEAFQPELGPQWYVVSRADQAIGYRQVVLGEQEIVERPYRLREESKMRLDVGGAEALVQYELESELDPAFLPVRMAGTIQIGQIEMTLDGQQDGDLFVLTLGIGEETYTREIAQSEGLMTVAGLYPRLSSFEWGAEVVRRFQIVDPVTGSPRSYDVRLLGEEQVTGPEGEVSAQRFELQAFGLKSEVVVDERGKLYSETASGISVQLVDIDAVSAIYRELN